MVKACQGRFWQRHQTEVVTGMDDFVDLEASNVPMACFKKRLSSPMSSKKKYLPGHRADELRDGFAAAHKVSMVPHQCNLDNAYLVSHSFLPLGIHTL